MRFKGPCVFYNKLNANNNLYIFDAFKDDDGKKVPVIFDYDAYPKNAIVDPNKMIGSARLENRSDCVYCYIDIINDLNVKEIIKFLGTAIIGSITKININPSVDYQEITEGHIWAILLTLYPSDEKCKLEETLEC